MSDGKGGGGWLHQAPAVSVLIFVTPKPNDNFSLAFLLTFMQKKNLDFLTKILSCRSSGHNQPPPHPG